LVHPSIKGIYDEPGKPSEKGIVVFKTAKRAFSSYGKDGLQGLNAPISIRAALGYVTALNWLITNRRFRIGDATTVFWTDKPDLAEELLPWMLSGTPVSENDETKRISSILAKVARGTLGADDFGNQNTEYYILGLSPNASRLSVRFWQTGDLGELITNLKLHFNHLEIVQEWDDHSKHPDSQTPNVRELLLQIVPLKDGRRDESKIPPQLSGALMCSILEGTRYPDSLAQGVMNRIRIIEKKPKGDGTLENVTYLRAAILKAWLLRNHNEWLNQQNITMTTALDKDNPSVAYQLGRLFAIYEQAQRAAHEYKLERTIRETMFSSASSTPLAIFVRLDKLNKHHLQKLKQGSKNYLNDLIDEIHQKITASGSYPASLDLKKQSLFCIGYYHQRHDIRQKK
jgi:CRISPR-associated protein Csd1